MSRKYSRQIAHWDDEHREYTCTDGAKIVCRFDITDEDEMLMPVNGLWLRRGKSPILMVNEA